MKCGPGTGRRCRICVGQMRCDRPSGGSTFLREMTSWPPSWKCDVASEIRLRQSMRNYLTNSSVKLMLSYLKERSLSLLVLVWLIGEDKIVRDTCLKLHSKGNGNCIAVMEHHLTATECHLPYGITQCYLLSDTSEHTPPSPQPVRPVLDLPTPEGWKAELT